MGIQCFSVSFQLAVEVLGQVTPGQHCKRRAGKDEGTSAQMHLSSPRWVKNVVSDAQRQSPVKRISHANLRPGADRRLLALVLIPFSAHFVAFATFPRIFNKQVLTIHYIPVPGKTKTQC